MKPFTLTSPNSEPPGPPTRKPKIDERSDDTETLNFVDSAHLTRKGKEFAEHFGVSDNQHLFGVLESLFLLSFSRYGGAAGGASGPRILRFKAWRPTLILVQANM